MTYNIMEENNKKYLKFNNKERILSNEKDGLEVINGCFETNIKNIMLYDDVISSDFYDLKTGLAGFVLQKFTNYNIKAALVLKDEGKLTGRFKEMADESNKGNIFRVFLNEEDAKKWLTN